MVSLIQFLEIRWLQHGTPHSNHSRIAHQSQGIDVHGGAIATRRGSDLHRWCTGPDARGITDLPERLPKWSNERRPGWWLSLPLCKIWVSQYLDDDIPNWMKKMFQTTNQCLFQSFNGFMYICEFWKRVLLCLFRSIGCERLRYQYLAWNLKLCEKQWPSFLTVGCINQTNHQFSTMASVW